MGLSHTSVPQMAGLVRIDESPLTISLAVPGLKGQSVRRATGALETQNWICCTLFHGAARYIYARFPR
jgi:hypothetical protein